MNRFDPPRNVLPARKAAASLGAARRAVFLCRDGLLQEDRGTAGRPTGFAWLPGAISALRALRRGGWRLVVVSHQPDIARGLLGPAEYDNLTGRMNAELARQDLALDAVYHCPHLPDAPLAAWRCQCACRMPQPGMLRRAARDLGLELARCVIVGQAAEDLQAGHAAGVAAGIRLVGTQEDPARQEDMAGLVADFTCNTLVQAADWLLHHEKRQHA
jgi:D-glycero-D-manno-heptose 1,7-bisphosphate phosphatase